MKKHLHHKINIVFNAVRDFIAGHDLFIKIFCIFFVSIIVPVSVTYISFYSKTEKLVRTQTELSNSSYLSSLATRTDVALDTQKMQMADYSLKDVLTKSFNRSNFAKESTALLINAVNANDSLYGAFVVDLSSGKIASNLGTFAARTYFEKYITVPNKSYDEIYTLISENRGFHFVGSVDYKRYKVDDDDSILLLFTYFADYPYGSNRVMGFILSPDLFEGLIDERSISRQGEICILDNEGTTIYCTDERIKDISIKQDLINGQTYSVGDEECIVQFLSSKDFYFVNVIPVVEYYAGLTPIRNFSILMVSILLAMILLFSTLLSRRISTPFIQLANVFNQETAKIPRMTPIERTTTYQRIYANINEIRTSNQRLSLMMEQSKKHTLKNTILDILRGKNHDQKFYSYQIAELCNHFEYGYFTLILLSFDFYKRAYEEYTPIELNRIQDGICNLTANWQFPFEHKIEFVEFSHQNFVFLMNTNELMSTAITAALQQIIHLADIDNSHMRLVYVSTPFIKEPNELPVLFQNAISALRYRMLNRQSQVIQSNHLPVFEASTIFLTEENKNRITNYLISNEPEAAGDYICTLIERRANSNIPYEHLITSFSSILALIAQVMTERGVPFFPQFNSNPFAELNEMKNLDEIFDFFRNICRKAVSAITEIHQERSDVLKRSLEFIDRNFCNHISLDDVSSYVGYSPKYFSRYFREQTGITFVNYLNRIRIQKAKVMLTDLSITVKEVSTRVGFDNTNSFIRVFKQFEGVTPGQYQQAHSVNADIEFNAIESADEIDA